MNDGQPTRTRDGFAFGCAGSLVLLCIAVLAFKVFVVLALSAIAILTIWKILR